MRVLFYTAAVIAAMVAPFSEAVKIENMIPDYLSHDYS